MNIEKTKLEGVCLITPPRFGDNRGFFSETFSQRKWSEAGFSEAFVQDNHSFSVTKGTVRGLHFQAPPHAQAKLVRCGRGALFDVAVDIRKGSPTYGQWFGAELSFENGRQLLIPAGFLHGFSTLEENTEIIYKCSDYYAPETEGAVRFDDPDLAIDWQVDTSNATVSAKDAEAGTLADLDSPFVWEGGQ